MTTLMGNVTAVMLISGATTHMATLQQNPVVVFETEKGAIEVEVDTVHAPASAANFLKYVDGGFYAGGSVNRAGVATPMVRGSPCLAASSMGWMWSERFRRRRRGQPDLLAASRSRPRSESSGLRNESERRLTCRY